jgi:hypothetical protein
MNMNVNLHIDTLVLEGVEVAWHERGALRAAVEGELARLLTEGGVSADFVQGGAVRAVRGGTVQLSEGGRPDGLGQQIAQAVYGGIGQ